jgi:deoxyribonuclease V
MKEDGWPGGIEEAREIQRALKDKIKITPLKKTPQFIAAADASFTGDCIFAAAALYRLPGLVHEKISLVRERTRFPYVPGLFAFREGAAIISALGKLNATPDLILVDGHGTAHPEGCGIASHVGVLLGIPTIGCAKSRLVGEFQEPGPAKGSWGYIYYRGMKVGAVVRTRDNVKPVFVSPGHLVDIRSSVEIVMRCVSGYRIPEPLRTADRLSKEMRRDYQTGLP